MKDYRYCHNEIERLGQRLDAASHVQNTAKSDWARTHWSLVVDQLRTKWQRLQHLHNGGAVMTAPQPWRIDHDWWEDSEPAIVPGAVQKIFNLLSHVDLTWSWENNRAQRLARSQG
jgi:hypothetical protein